MEGQREPKRKGPGAVRVPREVACRGIRPQEPLCGGVDRGSKLGLGQGVGEGGGEEEDRVWSP